MASNGSLFQYECLATSFGSSGRSTNHRNWIKDSEVWGPLRDQPLRVNIPFNNQELTSINQFECVHWRDLVVSLVYSALSSFRLMRSYFGMCLDDDKAFAKHCKAIRYVNHSFDWGKIFSRTLTGSYRENEASPPGKFSRPDLVKACDLSSCLQ